jgi:predicted enzyme related to lactoylglutathione lyase
MKNPVINFEIPVNDLDRAVQFYQSVFGCTLERAEVDGNTFAWFPVDNDAPGISGALAKGESYTPSVNGTRIYFSVDDIDATLAKVHAAGGKTMYPKTDVGELGFVAEFEDSEGNRIALHAKID